MSFEGNYQLKGGNKKMQEQTQQTKQVRITRGAMEQELGDSYKRCWAFAFKYAGENLEFEEQVDNLSKEFDLLRSQAVWFINGANSILFKKEAKESRNHKPSDNQRKIIEFIKPKNSLRYVSELEMMSFLNDLEEMIDDIDFTEYWQELNQIKQTVLEQQCATEKEVLKIFRIRSMVEASKEVNERFFDAYPVSTDAWENGHFDKSGEIAY